MTIPTYGVEWKSWDPSAAVRAADVITDRVVEVLEAGATEEQLERAAWWTWFVKEAVCGEPATCSAWRGAGR